MIFLLCKLTLIQGQRQSMAPIRGEPSALFRSEPVAGRCRVLCYHPDHSKTLADMTEQEALAVVQLWASRWGPAPKPSVGAGVRESG